MQDKELLDSMEDLIVNQYGEGEFHSIDHRLALFEELVRLLDLRGK